MFINADDIDFRKMKQLNRYVKRHTIPILIYNINKGKFTKKITTRIAKDEANMILMNRFVVRLKVIKDNESNADEVYAYVLDSNLDIFILDYNHYPQSSTFSHIVESGESWWGIANKYMGDGNKMHELAAFNDCTINRMLYPGDKLKIPVVKLKNECEMIKFLNTIRKFYLVRSFDNFSDYIYIYLLYKFDGIRFNISNLFKFISKNIKALIIKFRNK